MGQSGWVSGGIFVSFISASRDAKALGRDGDCGWALKDLFMYTGD